MMDCAARWVAVHLEHRKMPSTLNAQLGTAIHKGTAVFDNERVKGQEPSLSAAQDAAADSMDHPHEEIALQEDDKPAQAKDIAVSLVGKYCTEFSPGADYAAVEVGVEALELTDLGITLSGTADRVRRTEDGVGISDLKSGKTIINSKGQVQTAGHAAQLGVYELLAEAALGQPMTAPAQIIGLQTNVTPEKQRIAAGEMVGAREVLVGDADNVGLLSVVAKVAHAELVWGNPRSFLCHERFCPNFKTCFWRR